MIHNKKVGLILVNYKDYAKQYLTACRNSLRFQDYPHENFVVYIVDNATSQDSRNFIKDLYPEAKLLLRSDGNYAAANNLGCQAALKDGCDYMVVVNMDTEMEKNWLTELVLALDNNPEVGVAQAKILLYSKEKDGKENLKINTLGNKLHFLGFGYTTAYGQEDRDIKDYPLITGYASGCCFIFRKEVFLDISGWNEEYYMYHDDIEFSLRARLAGYKIILAPRAVIFHKYEFSRSIKMLYYMERNRALLILSFYPKKLLLFLAPAFIIMSLGLLILSIIKGWFVTWIQSMFYFLYPSTWWKIYKFRKNIKNNSRLSFRLIADNLEGRLDFVEIDNIIWRYFANPLFNLYWLVVKKII